MLSFPRGRWCRLHCPGDCCRFLRCLQELKRLVVQRLMVVRRRPPRLMPWLRHQLVLWQLMVVVVLLLPVPLWRLTVLRRTLQVLLLWPVLLLLLVLLRRQHGTRGGGGGAVMLGSDVVSRRLKGNIADVAAGGALHASGPGEAL